MVAGVSPGVSPDEIDLFLCYNCDQIWIVVDFCQLKMDLNEGYMELSPARNKH